MSDQLNFFQGSGKDAKKAIERRIKENGINQQETIKTSLQASTNKEIQHNFKGRTKTTQAERDNLNKIINDYKNEVK